MTPGYAEDLYFDSYEDRKRFNPSRKRNERGRRFGEDTVDHDKYSIPPPPPVPPARHSGHDRSFRPRSRYGDDWRNPEPRYSRRYPRREPQHEYDDYDSRRSPRRSPGIPPTTARGGYYSDEGYYPPPGSGQRGRKDYEHVHEHEDDYEDEPRDRRSRGSDRPDKRPPVQEEGRGSRGMVIVVIIIFALLILFIFRGPIMEFLTNPPHLKNYETFENVEFTIEKRITVECDPNGRGSYIDFKIKSACPKDNLTENFLLQEVKDVDPLPIPTSGFPNYRSQTQEIMYWEQDQFTGETTFVVEFTIKENFYRWGTEDGLDTEDSKGENGLEAGDSGNIDDIPDSLKQRYNHDEWVIDKDNDGIFDPEDDIDGDNQEDYLIEMTNPTIKSLAGQLSDGEQNVYKVIKNIYEYLTKEENLNYVTTRDSSLPKACTTTWAEKSGDCDDYSILFISICRAAGIPAWLQLGVLYDRQKEYWGGHAWAKVAIPLKSGGLVAPSIDIVNTNNFKYFKHVLYHDPYRFIEWTDTGTDELYPGETIVKNNLDYYYHVFSYTSHNSPYVSSSDEFRTVSIKESGDKIKIPLKGGELGLGLCMIPGFESSVMVVGLVFTIFIVVGSHSKSKKKYLQ